MSHTATAPLRSHPLGHLGRWAKPRLAEEMLLIGQHQRVDIPAHARTAYSGLLQKRLEEDLCWTVPHMPLDDPIGFVTTVQFCLLLCDISTAMKWLTASTGTTGFRPEVTLTGWRDAKNLKTNWQTDHWLSMNISSITVSSMTGPDIIPSDWLGSKHQLTN